MISKEDWIRRKTHELNIDKIESVAIEQGFWGRIFNYGDIELAIGAGTKERFSKIKSPLAFKKACQVVGV